MIHRDSDQSGLAVSFPLQFCGSILIAISAFILWQIFSHIIISEPPIGFWSASAQIFIKDCLAVIFALFIVFCIISKKYRLIISVPLLYLLIFYYTYRIIRHTFDWSSLIINFFILSITLFFVIILIYFIAIMVNIKNGDANIYIKQPLLTGCDERSPAFLITFVLALVSVPTAFLIVILSAVITIFICGWLFAAILSINIPIITPFLLLLVIPLPFTAIGIVFKTLSIVIRNQPSFLPAVNIELSKCPKLTEFMTNVSLKLNAQIPDHILLHAAPFFFVSKGSFMTYNGIINGTIFGISPILLNEFKADELRFVVAHENAHLRERDTLYGSFVEPSYKLLLSSMEGLVKTTSYKITYFYSFAH